MRIALAPVLVALVSLSAACGDDGGTTTAATSSGSEGQGGSGDGGNGQGGAATTSSVSVTTGDTAGSTTTGDGGGATTGEGGGTTGDGGGPTGDGGAGQGGDGGAGDGGAGDGGADTTATTSATTAAATTAATTAAATTAASSSSSGGGNDCTVMTAAEFQLYSIELTTPDTFSQYVALATPNLDGNLTEVLSAEFYGPTGGAVGTRDLSLGVNANYGTCLDCFRLVSDTRQFFQTGGTLTVEAGSDTLNGVVTATVTDLTLEEVTIAQGGTSTPVPNGECITITSATLDVDIAVPPAEWTCDEDYWFDGDCDCGCGTLNWLDCADATSASCQFCDDAGSCSEGYEGCPGAIDPEDSGVCIDPGACTIIQPDEVLVFDQGLFLSAVSPNLDGAAVDLLDIEIFTTDEGAFDLAAGANANYGTCEQCVLVRSDEFAGPIYFQQTGSITLDPASDVVNETISGTMTNVRLVEVTIAPAPSYTSTPVPNGQCLLIPSLAFTTE